MDAEGLIRICTEKGTKDPVKNFEIMTSDPEVPMHGPIHHVIVPFALLTALWNTEQDFDLEAALKDAAERMSPVPGAICGRLGVCGAAIGAGATSCIVNHSTPLSKGDLWSNNIKLTSEALGRISDVDGPRCCKRDSVISIMTACDESEKFFGKKLECSEYRCDRMKDNSACIGKNCPFCKKN